MTDYSKLSDREIDALVAEKLDAHVSVDFTGPDRVWAAISDEATSLTLMDLPAYTASFDEAVRVLQAWGTASGYGDGMESVDDTLSNRFDVERYDLSSFLLHATPRDICVAMLKAVEERHD